MEKALARIDQILVDRGLVQSRTEAQRLIEGGRLRVNNLAVEKSNKRYPDDCAVELQADDQPYISRGGVKLAAALNSFQIDPMGAVCLDVGISTGGFTDCLFKRGARRIVGVDVGHGQLHSKLHNHPALDLREKTNARFLLPSDFDQQFDIITVDVSFISLTLIVPSLTKLMKESGTLICLVKPQFEVGQGRLGKNGIVTAEAERVRACESVHNTARQSGLTCIGTGGDGNREYLSAFRAEA